MPDRTQLDAMAVQLIAAMRDPMKSGSSPDRKGQSREPAKAPKRMPVPEREVTVRRAVEGVTTGKPAERGMWRVEEGPHGELLFEKRDAI
jgi:hypothetical protein